MKSLIAIFKAGSPWSIIIALLVLVLAAVPVAAVLGLLSLGLDEVFMRGRLSRAMGEFVWDQQKNFLLIAIPLYIMMGEIILRSGIGQRMYAAVALWLPGETPFGAYDLSFACDGIARTQDAARVAGTR